MPCIADISDLVEATTENWCPQTQLMGGWGGTGGVPVATGGAPEPDRFTELFGIASMLADSVQAIMDDYKMTPDDVFRYRAVLAEFEEFERRQLGM